jgi:ABC-type dipeptide/oligopeptide/nickel transport system permease subunit
MAKPIWSLATSRSGARPGRYRRENVSPPGRRLGQWLGQWPVKGPPVATAERLHGVAPTQDRELPATSRIEGRSPWVLAWQRLRRDRVAIGSAIVILLVALMAICAPLIAWAVGHGPNQTFPATGLTSAGLPRPPSTTFLLGTDDLGRDVLVRVAYGARISLLVGVAATGLAVLLGVGVGLLAGYFGGHTDSVLGRLMDIVLSFPLLLFAIALVAIVGPSLPITIIVIAFFSWAPVGRVVRGQTLALKEREFVEAARSLGASNVRIMFVDILPNLAAPIIVYATLLIPAAVAFEATLSFLGLGIVPPTAEWGNMLAEAVGYYQVAWWFLVFPGAALIVTTLAFNLLGDAVRDALDPRAGALFGVRTEAPPLTVGIEDRP